MLLATSNSSCELMFIECPENPIIGSSLHTDNQSKLFNPVVVKSIILIFFHVYLGLGKKGLQSSCAVTCLLHVSAQSQACQYKNLIREEITR